MITLRSKFHFKRTVALAAFGAATAALIAGCGGASTSQPSLGATQAQSPVIFGVNATAASEAGVPTEISGLGDASGSTTSNAYITAATASTAVVSPTIAGPTGTIPLGFAPGAATGATGSGTMVPVLPGHTNVAFYAAIANGVNPTTRESVPINPNSVTLASSDPQWTLGTLPLTFTGNTTTSPYPNGTYSTAAFTLPFTTTGLHYVTASVADTSGQSSTTTFAIAVLAPTDAMYYDSTLSPGDTVTITGDLGVPEQKTADQFGTVVLFAAPGTQTVTVTPASGAAATTSQVTLVAGQATVVTSSGSTQITAAGRQR